MIEGASEICLESKKSGSSAIDLALFLGESKLEKAFRIYNSFSVSYISTLCQPRAFY